MFDIENVPPLWNDRTGKACIVGKRISLVRKSWLENNSFKNDPVWLEKDSVFQTTEQTKILWLETRLSLVVKRFIRLETNSVGGSPPLSPNEEPPPPLRGARPPKHCILFLVLHQNRPPYITLLVELLTVLGGQWEVPGQLGVAPRTIEGYI